MKYHYAVVVDLSLHYSSVVTAAVTFSALRVNERLLICVNDLSRLLPSALALLAAVEL